MGRLLKGGVWSNVEDEVLKSAIMKYGTNQWARVASLIIRKSAAQCKARWYEWLSPTVKKTEWTQDENEKLIHLAKVWPTQWRTISEMIGRTPTQCHQQYNIITEKLNCQKEGLGELSGLKLEDSIDIRPESRPAKPDPIDMAEDQIDMLSEARARLANTQGKKAKRKGRERQLILARRLAAVQQKRELAEVGINGRVIMSKKKPGINYNEEIPFYQAIPKGFHDTTKDTLEVEEKVIGKKVSDLEFESRENREKRERKKDATLKRKREEENLPDVLKKTTNSSVQVKRSKMVLPDPKLGDEEFQDLWKVGRERDAYLNTELSTGQSHTNTLLTETMREREGAGRITAERTPLSTGNRLQLQADNLRALHYTKNPLLGGENPELHDLAVVEEARNRIILTPNTSLRASILGTPRSEIAYSTPGLEKGGVRYNPEHLRQLTTESLDQLPKPQQSSTAALAMAQADMVRLEAASTKQEPVETNGVHADQRLVDQEELDEARAEQVRKMEALRHQLRSQVIQRGVALPRPVEVNQAVLRPLEALEVTGSGALTDAQRADELVKREMVRMARLDNLQNSQEIPALGRYCHMTRTERRKIAESLLQTNSQSLEQDIASAGVDPVEDYFDEMSLDDLKAAREIMDAEMGAVKAELQQQQPATSLEAYSKVWEECLAQVLYLPGEKRYTRANLVNKKDRVECFKFAMEFHTRQYQEICKQAQKLEDKLTTFFNGYMTKDKILRKEVEDINTEVELSNIELASLQKVRIQEQGAMVRRVETLEMDVDRQKIRERTLQQRFAELNKERDMLIANKKKRDAAAVVVEPIVPDDAMEDHVDDEDEETDEDDQMDDEDGL